jgi:hypothetical protein
MCPDLSDQPWLEDFKYYYDIGAFDWIEKANYIKEREEEAKIISVDKIYKRYRDEMRNRK